MTKKHHLTKQPTDQTLLPTNQLPTKLSNYQYVIASNQTSARTPTNQLIEKHNLQHIVEKNPEQSQEQTQQDLAASNSVV